MIEYHTKRFFNHQMMSNNQNVSDIRATLAPENQFHIGVKCNLLNRNQLFTR